MDIDIFIFKEFYPKTKSMSYNIKSAKNNQFTVLYFIYFL